MTLELAIKEAIQEKAPDVTSIEVEGVVPAPDRPSATFIAVDQLHGNNNKDRVPTSPAGAPA